MATEVTRLAHGQEAAQNAKNAALSIFNNTSLVENSGLPTFHLNQENYARNVPLFKVLVLVEFCKSNKEAKRLIAENGARVNDQLITELDFELDFKSLEKPIKISAGKKRHVLLSIKG